MKESNLFKKEQKKTYQFFKNPEYRKDIYEFSKGVSQYLHDEKIPNILLIDTSARQLWIGIDEYWKLHYSKEKCPNIYFVNPDGFDIAAKVVKSEDLTHEKVALDRMRMYSTGESLIQNKIEEINSEVKEQFEAAYSKLEHDKEKPLAVFDNCIHTGETMLPIIGYLHNNGYEDIRIVVGETSRNSSRLRINKHFTDKVRYVACGAFGRDTGVIKSDDNVFSKRNPEADREKVIQCREEMRRIVRDEGK